MASADDQAQVEGIAVIGVRGRFPGARNLSELWQNLKNGVESITFFSPEELKAAGVDPAVLAVPGFVAAGAVLDDVDMFDAHFFGLSARDAELMDPQQRLFLECAWESLEDAGYNAERYPGMIGVFAGCDWSTYMYNIWSSIDQLGYLDGMQLAVGNDKDHLTTHVSYKLNLRGPSLVVQTACSTSLVAVCLACQSLATYQSDIALAGGVAVSVPQRKGYLYQPGGITSPDGHCRPFDAEARGTVIGSGVGIVVLKRLSEALADGDHIRAVIKGWALNNDGSAKVGYTAPSIEGQAQCIAMAQALAGFDPSTITYVEAHGTGTALGDPIEVAALTQVFRAKTDKQRFCALGAVKSNFGHLASAAGVAALVKTVLALENRMLPPSLHFKQPNPQIQFDSSPFYVSTELAEWKTNGLPRRAGVSSFGIGGTNAHVVLEESAPIEPSGPSRPAQLLTLSARSSPALERVTDNLVDYLRRNSDANLADVAYTYHVGRKAFGHRRIAVVTTDEGDDTVRLLEARDPSRVVTATPESRDQPVAFMFPGQGTQYVDMGVGLYETERVYRDEVDRCCELLRARMEVDLRDIMFPPSYRRRDMQERLSQTAFTQPALFTVEYALAKLWMAWGVHPSAMIGHSIGEYVCACLGGILGLEDALALVAARGQLMNSMPAGGMLAVALPEAEVQPLLARGLSVAAVNTSALTVLSGPLPVIQVVASELRARGVFCRLLQTSHAFHSDMMDPIVPAFVAAVRSVQLRPPALAYVSNVTGTWATADTVLDPEYWGHQLRSTVRFAEGMQTLLESANWILLEVGPGQTLCTLGRQQPAGATHVFIPSMPVAQGRHSDVAAMLEAAGRLWLAGVQPDWAAFYADERRHRVPLPTYPFERQCYWIGPSERPLSVDGSGGAPTAAREVADWFYVPVWKPSAQADRPPDGDPKESSVHWLLFADECGLGYRIAERLSLRGHQVTQVVPGDAFERRDSTTYQIRPEQRQDYERLVKDLKGRGRVDRILHLWSVTRDSDGSRDAETFERLQYRGFHSLAFLTEALHRQGFVQPMQLGIVANHLQVVSGGEALCPAKATMLGISKVIPQEHSNVTTRIIDVPIGRDGVVDERLADHVIAELTSEPFAAAIAYRDNQRWVQAFTPLHLAEPSVDATGLRPRGVYVITGGLGNIGLTVARQLAQAVQARLVLIGRSDLADRDRWETIAQQPSADGLGQRVKALLELEELGAEVLVLQADVADRTHMAAALAEVRRRYGQIHGVIHGAGNVSGDAFHPVVQTREPAAQSHFRPKAEGAVVLAELLRDQPLDFVLLLSSLSAVLGGLGLAAYGSANAFLDVFAAQQNQDAQTRWISVNWDAWQFPGAGRATGTGERAAAILPAEGAEAFARIVAAAPPQVVVSTSPLQARLDKWVNLVSLRQEGKGVSQSKLKLHARPNLSSQFVGPRTDMERTIAEIWQELLGVAPVGIHDKFFELGGHSLLAIQLVARLRDAFQLEVPVQRVFEAPTVAELAERLERDLTAPGGAALDDEKLAAALRLVEQLSDAEVTAMLAKKTP